MSTPLPTTVWPAESEEELVAAPRTRRLRAVPAPAPRLARFPFLVVLMALFGVGMAGLLMLNTTLQNQAFQARTLTRTETELTYTQADLENQLDVLAAPQELARRASALGMRANIHPALLVVPSGKVFGHPKRVSGKELPSAVVKSPQQIAAEKATRLAVKQAKAARKLAAQQAKATAAAAAAKAKQEAAAQKAKDAGQPKPGQPTPDPKKAGQTKPDPQKPDQKKGQH